MRKDKDTAIELRHNGKSYKQISRELGIPIGTLSGWFKNEDWSKEIRDILAENVSFSLSKNIDKISKANKDRWELKRENHRIQARKDFEDLKSDTLFLAGIMLYWGEGDKILKHPRIRLANSDPDMIKIFYNFLTESVGVPKNKVRFWLLLYPDLVESVQINFWTKLLSVSKEQFNKSIYIKGKHATRRLSYGVCNAEVYSRELKEKFMVWIDLYKNEFGV